MVASFFQKNIKQPAKESKIKELLQGEVNARLVNDSFSSPSKLKGIAQITTPEERWAYAVEVFFHENRSAYKVLKLSFRLRGEIGIISVDRNGNGLEERIFNESSSEVTHFIDCTTKDFDRFFIRNTSPYGSSCIDLIAVEICKEGLETKSNKFPGFKNFEISKEDLQYWPDFYGSRITSDEQFFRSRWLAKQPSNIQISWQNDIKLCLDPKSNIAKVLIVSGYYEPFELVTFQFLSSISKVIIDVGANIGVFSLISAKTALTSYIYAIEPSKREFAILEKNLKINSLSNIEGLNIAAGEIDGQSVLGVAPQEIAGHNRISEEEIREGGWNNCFVECRKIDSIRLEKKIIIDLIKIDVEGHELAVLKGSELTLEKDRPHILLEIEGGLWTNCCHVIQVIALLQRKGYKIFDLDRSLGIWRKFSGWRSEGSGNILCVHSCKLEIVFEVNCHLIKQFNKNSNFKSCLQSVDVKSLDPLHIFSYPGALAINEARMAHLDSLNLDLRKKRVLEVGGGIGLLTPYFLSLGCEVYFTDSRKENLEIAKKRLRNSLVTELNLDEETLLKFPGQIDIIFCYGVFHHLANPARAISSLASTGAEMILLETCVNRTKSLSVVVDFEKEDSRNPHQASSGFGARPTREWIVNELKKHWKYVYFTLTQPSHPDFPENWNLPNATNTRAIFIGSNTECCGDSLISYQPVIQRELEINYCRAHFKSFEEAVRWIQQLKETDRFMIVISEVVPLEFDAFLKAFSSSAIITTLSSNLEGETLVCGRKT